MQIISGIGIINNALTDEYCDDLIKYFYKRTDLWEEGITLGGVNKDKKDAVQMWLKGTEHELILNKILYGWVIEYLQKLGENINWDYRSLLVKGTKYSGFKLQRYIKNEGHYNAIHQERDGTTVYKRMFVVMAYLNTVTDGGKTNFPYFDISVQPSKGTIVIWPAGMPYLHYGETPISEHKFIMTTWLEQIEG